MSDSIQLGSETKAFYAGVAAGNMASEAIGALPQVKDDFAARLRLFWLNVGAALTLQYPEAHEEETELFLKGAGLHEPEQRSLLVVRIDSLPGMDSEEEPDDDHDDAVRRDLAELLREAADKVTEGYDKGQLNAKTGELAGHYYVDLYA